MRCDIFIPVSTESSTRLALAKQAATHENNSGEKQPLQIFKGSRI
jgi:hypothetical protein